MYDQVNKYTAKYFTDHRWTNQVQETCISSSLGSSPGWKHYILFLGETLYYHSGSVSTKVKIGTGKLNAGGNPPMD